MTDIPSGLHRYAGNPLNLELRYIFRSSNIALARPCVGVRDDRVDIDGNKFDKALYLLHRHKDKWTITPEAHCNGNNGLNFLNKNGYRLKVVCEPSRCFKCNLHPKIQNRLEIGKEQVVTEKERDVAHSTDEMEEELKAANQSIEQRKCLIRDDLILPRRLAIDWRDAMRRLTSHADGDYGLHTWARRLEDIAFGNANRCSDPLRNHSPRLYEPCRCSLNRAATELVHRSDDCNTCLISCSTCFRASSRAESTSTNINCLDLFKMVHHDTGTTIKTDQPICNCRCIELNSQLKCLLVGGSRNSTPFLQSSGDFYLSDYHRGNEHRPSIGTSLPSCDRNLNKLLAELKINASDINQLGIAPHQDGKNLDSLNELEKHFQHPEHASKKNIEEHPLTALQNVTVNEARDSIGERVETEPGPLCMCETSHGELLYIIMEKYKNAPRGSPLNIGATGCGEEINDRSVTKRPDAGLEKSDNALDESGETYGFLGTMQQQSITQISQSTTQTSNLGKLRRLNDKAELSTDGSATVLSNGVSKQTLGDDRDNKSIEINMKDGYETSGGGLIGDHNAQIATEKGISRSDATNEAHEMKLTTQSKTITTVLPTGGTSNYSSAYNNYNSSDDTVVKDRLLVLGTEQSSIVLSVIMIDVFGRFLLLKPDINEQIAIDLEISSRSKNFSKSNHKFPAMDVDPHPENNYSPAFLNVFYHIETLPPRVRLSECEQLLKTIRHQFGLISSIEQYQSATPPMVYSVVASSSSSLSSSQFPSHSMISSQRRYDGMNFLSPMNGNLLVKLQLDIHFASGLPMDCRNVYVKYRVVSLKHKKWRLRKRRDDSSHVSLINEHSCEENSKHGSMRECSHKTKLEQMTHEMSRKPASSCDCKAIVLSARDAQLLDRREAVDPVTGNMIRNNYCEQQVDDECHDEILLQGSTVSSRPNYLGVYHFSCIEQIVLELSRNSIVSKDDIGYNSDDDPSSHSGRELNDEHYRKHTERYHNESIGQKTSSERGKQKSSRLDENSIMATAFNGIVSQSPPASICLQNNNNESSTTSATTNSITTKESNDLPNRSDNSLEQTNDDNSGYAIDNSTGLITDRNNLNDKNLEHGDSGENTGTCNGGQRLHEKDRQEHMTSHHSIKSNRSSDSELVGWQREHQQSPNQITDKNLARDTDDICEISLIFEIYSSGCYFDKIQGLSHLNLPICSTYSSVEANVTPDSQTQFTGNNSSRRYELPVIKPALRAPMDRLRYYLTGELPYVASSSRSFTATSNRYMTHTESSGKLMVDVSVTRQFSDPDLDMALRDLINSRRDNRRRQLSVDKEVSEIRVNAPSPDQVIGAYEKAKLRLERTKMNSLLNARSG